MRILFMMLAALLAGCATTDARYYQAIETANKYQYETAKVRAEAEAVRYGALMRMAESGDATTKVAAAMGLAMAGMQSAPAKDGAGVLPQPPQSAALQWAQVLAGPLTQLGGAYFGMKTQMRASDNARDVSVSTNATMLGFGQAIRDGSTAGYPYINPPAVIAPDPVIVAPQPPVIVQPEVVQIPTQIVEPVIVPQAVPQ